MEYKKDIEFSHMHLDRVPVPPTTQGSWIDAMPRVIDDAAVRAWANHAPAIIVVDVEPKAVLGRDAAARMYPGYDIQFEVDPQCGTIIPYLKVSEGIASATSESGHKSKDPCVTRTPGTGVECECDFDCDNYWLMAAKEGMA